MSTQVLDDEWQESSINIIILKYFYQDTEAELYALRLREADIPSFTGNTASQNMIPQPGQVALYIREEDQERALEIVGEMDTAAGHIPATINEWKWVLGTLGILLLLLLLRYFWWIVAGF